MKRAAFTVLAILAAAPSIGSAQGVLSSEPVWGARVRVTPFVGQAPSVSRSERWVVLTGGDISFGEFDVDLASGPALGASVDARLVERIGLIGSVTYISRGQTREFSFLDGEFFVSEGSTFLTGKLALALRLREAESDLQLRRLTATVFAGPALVRESPSSDPSVNPALRGSLNHWAANFGVDGEIPMGDGRLALQLGLEDYYTFWNTTEIARRNDRVFAQSGLTTQSTLESNASHQLLIRLGLSVRFQ